MGLTAAGPSPASSTGASLRRGLRRRPLGPWPSPAASPWAKAGCRRAPSPRSASALRWPAASVAAASWAAASQLKVVFHRTGLGRRAGSTSQLQVVSDRVGLRRMLPIIARVATVNVNMLISTVRMATFSINIVMIAARAATLSMKTSITVRVAAFSMKTSIAVRVAIVSMKISTIIARMATSGIKFLMITEWRPP